jgi:transposase-like protein
METMENGARKRYTKGFKPEAVRMLEAGEKSGHQIEEDLGIGSGQVYKWRKELARQGQRPRSRWTRSSVFGAHTQEGSRCGRVPAILSL